MKLVATLLVCPLVACTGSIHDTPTPPGTATDARSPDSDPSVADAAPTGGIDGGTVANDAAPSAAQPRQVAVTLIPDGASGVTRISFAVPLAPGEIDDENRVRVAADGKPLAAYRHGLATYPDHSLRSVLIQVEVDVSAVDHLTVTVGQEAGAGSITGVPVADTLNSDGEMATPKVWALLSPEALALSGVVGPEVPEKQVRGTELDAWTDVCDYDRYDTSVFLEEREGDRGPWLYDRVTAMVRGYALTGELAPLESAYREAHIYFNGLSGHGTDTRIGVPTAEGDVKYHYTQGMAIHYLLTGDERFRTAVEDVADRVSDLWPSPGYAGGDDFWTERHAGFALLAYVWAATVSEDRGAEFLALADEAVDAYLEVQDGYSAAGDGRCFAHRASAHGEPYGYTGCSPWMSAILADGLDAYARLRGGDRAQAARDAIVALGRAIADSGRDGDGKPYYWMSADGSGGEVDDFDEHWGESAYVIAMAWYFSGQTDDDLRAAAMDLLAGLAQHGEAPHIRSFNWQCRSAPLAPYFLAE